MPFKNLHTSLLNMNKSCRGCFFLTRPVECTITHISLFHFLFIYSYHVVSICPVVFFLLFRGQTDRRTHGQRESASRSMAGLNIIEQACTTRNIKTCNYDINIR